MIRKALNQIYQKRNLDQYSTVLGVSTYINANRGEDSQPIELYQFMPHPLVWRQNNTQKKINISKNTAIQLLADYPSFNSEMLSVFDEWIEDIRMAASG